MKFFKFLITFLSLNFTIFAQTPIPLNPIDGMPADMSDNLKERFGPSYYFELDGKPFFNDIYLVHKGDVKNTIDNFWLFRRYKNDKGYRYSNVVFEKDTTYHFFAKEIFETDTEDELSPLLIFLNEDYDFSYCWEDSKTPKIVKKYPYKIGSKFPEIKLVNSNTSASLNEFLGKIVVINWWATDCTPCILEIPGLNKLAEKYPKIEFVSIVDDEENLESFLEKHPFNYTHYFGDEKTKEIFGISYPRNIILDENGVIIFNKTGAGKDTYKHLEEVILTHKN